MKIILNILILSTTFIFSEDLEVYRFPKEEDSLEIVIAYRFSSFELEFEKEENKMRNNLQFNYTVDLNDTIIVGKWKQVSTKKFDENTQIIGLKRIIIPNKSGKIEIAYNTKNGSEQYINRFKKIYKKDVVIGDIIPAYVLQKDKYFKNKNQNELIFDNYGLIPNASHEIAGGENFLKYLFQINQYNSEIKFNLVYEILDAVERVKHREIYNDQNIDSQNRIYANMINVSKLPTGSYYLKIKVLEKKSGKTLDENSTKFFVVSSRKPELISNFTEDELYERSIFATMDQEMVDLEYRQMRFILTNQEKDQFSQLSDLKAQKRALYKYWSRRDPNPRTEQNERRMEFEKAIQYANVYYNESLKEGWNSDRGRILIKYGFPQQVDQYEQKAEKRATEVWFYGGDFGGLYFYFIEMSNNNDFQLVHSTHPQELQNEYWVEEFDPAIDDSGIIERNPNYMRESGRR